MGSLAGINSSEKYEEVKCCLCGGMPRKYAVDFRGNQLSLCERCNFLFVSPRLRFSAMLEQVYESSYYLENRSLESAVENCRYYLHQIQLHKSDKSTKGLLFDVGAGDGLMLETAFSDGWKIEGHDVQQQQVELLRKKLGCKIHLGFLENLEITSRYDVITLIHVIEHTLNPVEFLKKCETLLKPKGLLYAVFPNTSSLNDRIKNILSASTLKKKSYKHLAADHHLWFFSPVTARKLVEKTGFQIISLKTIFPRQKVKYWNSPLLNILSRLNLGTWIELIALPKHLLT
ncbi:MAG: class I SAM-dependent methyltransferase [Candidatus Riflebacteria bacterium]|nr:class I SAM-dependent methyltransferase [Candidatus Riflebacteria bacterium]